MNPIHLLPLFLVVLALAPAPAAEPAGPGEVLPETGSVGAWQALCDQLAGQGAVRSRFVEERWFSVRKQPVTLHGVLRHSKDLGLSLSYEQPAPQVMVVDRLGLLLRDGKGRTRALAADSRAPRMDAVLLPVLRFDLAEIRRYFVLRGARDGDDWRLDFVPRSPELARQLSTLTVVGAGDQVRRLEFRRSLTQRVIVRIESTETGVTFAPEEAKRYFR